MSALPYSDACERNREPILAVLQRHFAGCRRVLEIGSGTGQHAVAFAAALPQLHWQASERPDALPALRARLAQAALPNALPPLPLDVLTGPWPAPTFDAAFSANTLHILGWDGVEALFAGLGRSLAAQARLVVYGPFRRGGRHTAPSNAAFDAQLRARDPAMGVRDVEALQALAAAQRFEPLDDVALPANNACLVWQRSAA